MPDHVIGLDLGQVNDPAALAVLRREPVAGGPAHRFTCVHLERFPLGLSYPVIVSSVSALVARPELQPAPRVAIDATGVGRGVVDQFLEAKLSAAVVPITITSGTAAARRGRWNDTRHAAFWVPKGVLVAAVRSLLAGGRLAVARLPLAEALRGELLDFTLTITAAANETFGARAGAHDDLVLAVALAAWLGLNAPAPGRPGVEDARRFQVPSS